jgi:hypothetical protein
MPRNPGPITFTVAPLGRAYIPETQNTVVLANMAQKAFKFEFRAEIVPIEEDKYTLQNGALDLRKAVGDLLRHESFRRLASEQLILVSSKPDSDQDSARDYKDMSLVEQCYFYHDSLAFDESVPFEESSPYAKNTAIISTYIWDHLPSIAEVSKTNSGRRALEPYLFLSFAMIALSRCIDMPLPHHTETRGCPLDYCDTVQEIDRFFQGGRLCDECEHVLQTKHQDGEITAEQLDSVKKLLLRARGRDFEYDVFISHAWEDKDAIARALYAALVERGIKVWFDEATLELGDSLSRKIDYGLAQCRFGIVILSPRFLQKKWPRRELEGLVARETTSGEKAILPIWHELDAATLSQHSPTLADRRAARSEEGIPSLVDQILRVLKR